MQDLSRRSCIRLIKVKCVKGGMFRVVREGGEGRRGSRG